MSSEELKLDRLYWHKGEEIQVEYMAYKPVTTFDRLLKLREEIKKEFPEIKDADIKINTKWASGISLQFGCKEEIKPELLNQMREVYPV